MKITAIGNVFPPIPNKNLIELETAELLLARIKNLLYLIKEEKGILDIYEIRETVKGVLADPQIPSEVLKEVHSQVSISSIGFHLAQSLSEGYRLQKVGGGKTLYELVESIGEEIAKDILKNPNFVG